MPPSPHVAAGAGLGRALIVPLALALAGCSSCSPARAESRPATTPVAGSAAGDARALAERLAAALRAKGASYVPHTRHRNADGSPKYTNRLILESSPYLLQHAHNPVDWYAWGDEAFEAARRLGRPVFLSIGYSTCHWCHVMEEESFEDETIAAYLNAHYVAIKVDREERPDVDAVYMSFVQAFTGSGGWPMSSWLTAKREPFFAGTYFPPHAGARGGRGFLELLREQAERFHDHPDAIAAEAARARGGLIAASAPEAAGDFPPASLLRAAREGAAQRFDPAFGGARGAPKFPSSFPVELLLRFARRANDVEARRMALETLRHMRAGGIYDQLGGGFHRYSTDARWLVPHFEKMLYDNALLARAFLDASQVDGEPVWLATARETLDYMLRDLSAPDGTFFSATDADSAAADGRRAEGAFFTWTPAELRASLNDADAALALSWFGVSDAGNVDGRSVLSAGRARTDFAREHGLHDAELDSRLSSIRARLFAKRAERPPPFRDEKVIVAWNGLAISALARAALLLGDARYADAALRATGALTADLHAGRGLPHQLVAGRAEGRAFAEDHALLAAALLDVFELTAEPALLKDATALMDELERSFADPAHGGYFLSAASHEQLLARDKPAYDGPVPSASSVAASNWLRLYTLTGAERFRERAETTIRAFALTLERHPLALEHMLLALDWSSDAPKEIAIVAHARGAMQPDARALLAALSGAFAPNAVLVVGTEADFAGELGAQIPWLKEKRLKNGLATAYVCERGSCKLPTTDAKSFAAQLGEARGYPAP